MKEIKSFFPNEINDLRTRNFIPSFKTPTRITKTKLDFYQSENQLLKDETMAKQQAIEKILYQNNELLKLGQYYNKNILSKKPSLARLKKK